MLGVGHAIQPLAQPERGDGVGLDALRIEFGGESKPREDFAFVAVFAEVRVLGWIEIAAEARDPVFACGTSVIVFAARVRVFAFAVGVLAAAVDKSLGDVQAAVANPTTLILDFGQDMADFKANWPALKTFLATLGIKLP